MRICIGEYAYEVTNELSSGTGADGHWGYMIYRLTPVEALLCQGENSSREHADRNARQLIALYSELDRMKSVS